MREQGVLRGKQESPLRLVELKFGRIEPSTEQKVRSTSDAALLDMWIERILTASTLAELGVEP
ncbi:MAG: hypothetical protein HY720_07545 [Planctomycetes bacterium]|nr:hypothetical protein [Planctomycetota bacterium]